MTDAKQRGHSTHDVVSFRASLETNEIIERSAGSIRVLDPSSLSLLARYKTDVEPPVLEVYPPERGVSDLDLTAYCYRLAWLALFGSQAKSQEQAVKGKAPTVDVVVPAADPHISLPCSRGAIYQLYNLASSSQALSLWPYLPASTQTSFGLVQHPLRPPTAVLKQGRRWLYSRWIPHLSLFFTLRLATEDDLDLMHGWLNSKRVADAWGDDGTLEQHRDFIRSRIEDPHTEPVIGSYVDGHGNVKEAIYVDLYWTKEDRLGEYYEAQDYDQGLHLFVGSEEHRGSDYLRAWLPSVVHYLFLRDPRTQRVLAEPNVKNTQMLSIFDKFAGMKKQKEFDFPHKRSGLMLVTREEFFEGSYL